MMEFLHHFFNINRDHLSEYKNYINYLSRDALDRLMHARQKYLQKKEDDTTVDTQIDMQI